jgi:Spy/CpxP family protein refolding chaperone
MRLFSNLMMVAMVMATPVVVAAQAPPAPGPDQQGPGMEMQRRGGPGMGQRMGPGMGMQQGMGRRMGMPGKRGMMMRRGMARRFMRQHPGMIMHRMLQNPAVRERMKITPEQMTRLQAQESAMAKSGIRSRADIQVKRMELAELIRSDKPDRTLIDRKLREVQDATFTAEKARIDNQLATREMFTPEQRQEMEKMRGEFRGRMMQRGPGGPGDGGMMRRGPRGEGQGGPRPMGPRKAPPTQNPPPGDNSR